jgi:xanthine dehydrogenase accessory factor
MDNYRKALALLDQGRRFALATVIKSSGSTPQKAGAMALFEPDGPIHGTLGGGCLEAEARRRALQALDDGGRLVFDLTLDDDYGWDDGLICGGRVRVWVDPNVSHNLGAFTDAIESFDRRERGVILSRVDCDHADAGLAQFVAQSAIDESPIADAIREVLAKEKPALVESGGGALFIEPVIPKPHLIIAGGGHVGQAVAYQADRLGFDVTVIDDRPMYSDPARFPEAAETVCAPIAEEVGRQLVTPETYILIVTRGHRNDGVVLKNCIHSPAAYIGLIGSRRKIHLIRKGFIEEDIATEDQFARVFAPVGLDIGAVSVEEIATSITAQLIAVRRGKSGKTVENLAVFAKQK